MSAFRFTLGGLLLSLAACGTGGPTPTAPGTPPPRPPLPPGLADARPNVVLIVADDLGYADLGAFGSEIETPNLDALAAEGRLLGNHHTTPLCSTSRANLLTGADHHLVGVGHLPDFRLAYPGHDNYQGGFNERALTLAQRLFAGGYHTYMAGKWHLRGEGPWAWGFEQSFSLQPRAAYANNFAERPGRRLPSAQPYFENGVQAVLPEDFYSSNYFVDRLKQYIDRDHGEGRPFFAYLAFQAAHFPLQAPDADLARYRGRYDAGYEAIRAARIARQKQLGLIPADFAEHPGHEVPMTRFGQPGLRDNRGWAVLSPEERRSEARLMEVYAAMISNLDANVGRLIAHLKAIGEYENSLIVFTADNGADGLGFGFVPHINGRLNLDIDNRLENYGRPKSFLFLSSRWAEVGTAPFRLFKGFTAEGGTSVPTIVRLPGGSPGASRPVGAYSRDLDLVPTVLALAGLRETDGLPADRPVAPLEGRSLLPVLRGEVTVAYPQTAVFVDEITDTRVVRRGRWKLTRFANPLMPYQGRRITRDWQLFDIEADRGETRDLAAEHPEIVAELRAEWRAYVQRVGVSQPAIPWWGLPPLED